ncbi:Trp biosynthesis-associated membrane protein, partial [Phycicoccus sp.]|uniref:Trp biosynthesis-associated membrane protein n=1 Tax=Phycicoccus sp. TaxID=1902410 RepID=UPI002BCD9041
VVEMGMRGAGQIAQLAALAPPDVACVTAIGPVHLELLGTVEAVAAARAWPWGGRAGGLVVGGALVAALVGRRRWSGPSRRYEAPGSAEGHVAGRRGERVTSAWDDLSEGRDPTDVGDGAGT